MNVYKPDELFVYTNGDRWELGKVKRFTYFERIYLNITVR